MEYPVVYIQAELEVVNASIRKTQAELDELEPKIETAKKQLAKARGGKKKVFGDELASLRADKEATSTRLNSLQQQKEHWIARLPIFVPAPSIGLGTLTPSATLSDEERYNNILEYIEAGIPKSDIIFPTVFRLPEGSAHAEHINSRNIPCYPSPSQPQPPFLLTEGLTDWLTELDGTRIQGKREALIPKEEKATLRTMMAYGPAVMLGVSGSGKTRTIYEMLAEEFGLVFIANRGGNDGCKDLEDAVRQLELEGQAQQGLLGVTYVRPSPAMRNNNLTRARHQFHAVVMARLLLLVKLRQRYGDNLTPSVWLWMQMYPGAMSDSHKVQPLFDGLWTKCVRLSDGFIMDTCEKLTLEFFGKITRIPCFVDEAQCLLTQHEGMFPSYSAGDARSCFSAVVKSMSELCAGPVMSAIGIHITPEIRVVASAIGDKPGTADENVQYLREGHLTPEDCKNYISKYLNIPPDDLVNICNMLQGRPRFTERFVAKCIVSESNPVDVFEEYFGIQVTGEPKPANDSRLASKASVFWALHTLYNKVDNDARRRELIADLRTFALQYAITGQPQILESQKELELIEFGFANVTRVHGKLAAVIREPIVTHATCYFFGFESYAGFRLRNNLGYDSAFGNELESYIGLMLFDAKKPLDLRMGSPLIGDNAVGVPDVLRTLETVVSSSGDGNWCARLWQQERQRFKGFFGFKSTMCVYFSRRTCGERPIQQSM